MCRQRGPLPCLGQERALDEAPAGFPHSETAKGTANKQGNAEPGEAPRMGVTAHPPVIALFWMTEGTWSFALDTGGQPSQDKAVESLR